MAETSQTPVCSRCGAPLSADALKGLCPRCLMALNLAAPTEIPGESGPHETRVQPLPAPAEMARHFPQFEIIECLGRGGMGVVYKARQPKLNRIVALKVLAPEKVADAKFAERFAREAQALARLNHPNIVTVYDFGEVDGLYYLLMEFVDGVSLRELLQTRKIAPEEALAIVPKICEALQFAHEQGVVHRDIKPENVLLDKQGRVKIADFGIAKIVGGAENPLSSESGERGKPTKAGEGMLTEGHILGTPHYMAPEQVEKPQLVDHRADIYSLGVVFYEMLTGELPLGKFQPPSRKVQVDVRLDEVVLRALEKEVERRYQQASQVRSDVETIAQTQSDVPSAAASLKTAAELSKIEDARRRVEGPALALMMVGALNLSVVIAWLVLGVVLAEHSRRVIVALVPLAFLFLGYILTVVGAIQMKRLASYGLAITATLCAMLLPVSCLLGFPIGVWCLFVLSQREVRDAFGKGHLLPVQSRQSPRLSARWKLAVGSIVVLAITVAALLLTMLLPVINRRTHATRLPSGMVSWWRGDGSAADATGRNPGTLTGTGEVSYQPGVSGQAFVFDGLHRDRVDVGNPASLQLQDFTISAWLKRSSPTQTSFDILGADRSECGEGGIIFGYGRGGYGLGLLNNGRLLLSRIDIDVVYARRAIADTDWHHVAVTKRGDKVVFYVDGEPEPEKAYDHPSPYTFDTAAAIGSRGDERGGTFFGMVDEVAIYGRALSAKEIQSLGRTGLAGGSDRASESLVQKTVGIPAPPGLVGWWRGENDALDALGGINGTIQGSVRYVPGKVGRAFEFNGVDSGVQLENAASLHLQDFTVEAWVKRSSASRTTIPTMYDNSAFLCFGELGYGFGPTHEGRLLLTKVGVGGVYSSDLRITDTSFHHVAVTKKGGTVTFYVDGVGEEAESYDPNFEFDTSVAIGARGGDMASSFLGVIDELSVYNRALAPGEVKSIFAAGSRGKSLSGIAPLRAPRARAPAPPPSGLVSRWRGEKNALDSVGENDGTIVGDVIYEPGVIGQAFSFDGVNSGVRLGNPRNLQLQNFTIEAWVKRASAESAAATLDSDNAAFLHYGELGYGFGPRNDGTLLLTKVGVGGVYSSDLRITDTQFHHVAVTKDGSSVTFYVDGVGETAEPYDPGFVFDTPVAIGARGTDIAHSFFGLIDELAVYNRALTKGEIQSIHRTGQGSKRITFSSVIEGKAESVDLGSGVKMEFVLIPAGTFTMGTRTGSPQDYEDEKPAHQVTLSKAFHLGKFEVTQEQWEAVMQSNPSKFKGPRLPVENVSWDDAQTFLAKLGQKTGRKLSLPTEAQWEYACRAGTTTTYSFGDSDASLRAYGWFADNSEGSTHPVGEKSPNQWGLYDMLGNVCEWCADWYSVPYPNGAVTDPEGPASGTWRVIRGGAWTAPSPGLRSSNRDSDWRGFQRAGLRCVMLVDEPPPNLEKRGDLDRKSLQQSLQR